jgi:hypothetical protein
MLFPRRVRLGSRLLATLAAIFTMTGALAADIVRRFIATLDPGDTSCAARVPALRVVAQFATLSSRLDPAAALPGNTADTSPLKTARAVVMTVGDVLARVSGNSTGSDRGLRGVPIPFTAMVLASTSMLIECNSWTTLRSVGPFAVPRIEAVWYERTSRCGPTTRRPHP